MGLPKPCVAIHSGCDHIPSRAAHVQLTAAAQMAPAKKAETPPPAPSQADLLAYYKQRVGKSQCIQQGMQ